MYRPIPRISDTSISTQPKLSYNSLPEISSYKQRAPSPTLIARSVQSGAINSGHRDGQEISHPIFTMPIEILAEIISHLRPVDLLFLARTNKPIRRMVMTPSATHIWRAAESNVEGLPPCPADLTNAQYAALIFQFGCSTCSSRTPARLHSVLLVRICTTCLDNCCYRLMPQDYLEFVPSSFYKHRGIARDFCLRSDLEDYQQKHQQLSRTSSVLEAWLEQRRQHVQGRRKFSTQISQYLRVFEQRTLANLSIPEFGYGV